MAFPALWGRIIDGPVLILVTAMDDLQQGDRGVADAGINLGCIHERQCSKTDGDCYLGWYALTLATSTELFDPEQIDVGHGKGMSAFNERHAFCPSQPPV